ncbi:rhodanese-like domain-containing protein 4, chloroplastic [Rutidosis leptorrhynchoides]|uniref:rhodanese-like domain-containing protein 4, chloroplastic n=1 Tax=Rutidosis leptorrhynchoides TaxID=125765 RepID=UPI003A99B277
MEALNAASLTPISVLCQKRTEQRKITSVPLKLPNNSSLSLKTQNLNDFLLGGVVLVSSVLGSQEIAKALTYEEALEQSATSFTPDVDIGIIDSVVNFGAENPIIIAGGVAVLAVPLIVSQLLKQPKPFGIQSAKNAYAKLGEEANSQLLDIRGTKEIRLAGTPNIKGLGKKPVVVSYKSEDKNGFLNKLSLKFKQPEDTTLFILDKFDGSSELVAELVTVNGFKAAYAIKDGADGPRGWKNSGLPWLKPKKGFSLDLSSISGALGDDFGVAIGLAVATGLGALVFTEVETILQVLGSIAIFQFTSQKLLFAEERKQTLKQVDEFLNTKIAPKEIVGDIKEIGKAFLPSLVTSRALPSPTEATPASVSTTEELEAPQINSAPMPESQPLSPYTSYADFKPPTSPTPSQP